jgi:hypothetical protein
MRHVTRNVGASVATYSNGHPRERYQVNTAARNLPQ